MRRIAGTRGHATPIPRPARVQVRGRCMHRATWTFVHTRSDGSLLVLAGLAAPLVLSVHSTVSLDFSVSQLPGWHTTIFPPYFVAGAIYSGFGMVLTLILPLRKLLRLEELITMRHIDVMCKVTLVTGSIVGYAYAMEYFIAWYSGNPYERWTFWHRLFGTYWYGGWAMLMFNVLTPQVFWFKWARQNLA